MHDHVRTKQQNPPQKFHIELKNQKFFPKTLKPRSKCMKEGKMKRLRTLTKRKKLGLG